MTENYLERLQKYVINLEERVRYEKEALRMVSPSDSTDRSKIFSADWAEIRRTKEPIIRTIIAYNNCNDLFPELKSNSIKTSP